MPEPGDIARFRDIEPAAVIEAAARPGGVLYNAATELIEPGYEIQGPAEAYEIIKPESGQARWQALEDAPAKKKRFAATHADELYSLADQAGLRQPETITDRDIERIQTAYAEHGSLVVVAEGGANKTAAVRAAELEEALERAGVGKEVPLILLATAEHEIPVMRKGKPNPEQNVARSLAPDLPPGDLTQIDVTHGVQRRLAYKLVDQQDVPGVGRFTTYRQDRQRDRIVVTPAIEGDKGTVAGLRAIHKFIGLEGKQIVMGTNGQYREKVRVQTQLAALREGVHLVDKPVVIGDEAGFEVTYPAPHVDQADIDTHADVATETFTTAPRGPNVYLDEAAIAGRLNAQLQAAT